MGVVDIRPSSSAEGAACTDLVAVAGTAINVCIQRIKIHKFTNPIPIIYTSSCARSARFATFARSSL